MDKIHPLAEHNDHSVFSIAFFMSKTYSFDYEIMELPDTGGIPYVLTNVTMKLGDHKDAQQVSPKVFSELAWIEIGICHSDYWRGISGPSW